MPKVTGSEGSAAVAATTPSIRQAVAAGLEGLGQRTRVAVIEHFAAQKAAKQAQALIKGLGKLNDLEREYNKINRPDVVTYDGTGEPASSTFSKERIEERKKLTEQIEKLTNAVNRADDSNDFDKLFDLTK